MGSGRTVDDLLNPPGTQATLAPAAHSLSRLSGTSSDLSGTAVVDQQTFQGHRIQSQ
jgi:hypothetical protein